MEVAHRFEENVGGFERIRQAREIIHLEAEALQRLKAKIPADFDSAVELVVNCAGNTVVTGIGKAGWIGQKISATLSSTGTPSHFLHPSEAMHGDLGRIQTGDVVLVLSNSGETGEVLQLLPTFQKRKIPIIALTATPKNSLAEAAQFVLDYGVAREACPLGLAPSTSTTLMLALGDAFALVASRVKQFSPLDFAQFHPGGSLGRQLSTVDDIMRPLDRCRQAPETETVRQVYTRLQGPQRRTGAILLVNRQGELTGLFTDSDLARLLELGRDEFFDQPISQVMTREPITIKAQSRAKLAVETLARRNISELPVVDEHRRPLGIIDVTDVVGL